MIKIRIEFVNGNRLSIPDAKEYGFEEKGVKKWKRR